MQVDIVLCRRVQCGMWQLWQCAFAPFSGPGGFDIVRHQSGAYAFSVPVWVLPWWSSSLAIVVLGGAIHNISAQPTISHQRYHRPRKTSSSGANTWHMPCQYLRQNPSNPEIDLFHKEFLACCIELDFDNKRSDCEKPFIPWDKSRGNHCLKLVNALQFRCWDK